MNNKLWSLFLILVTGIILCLTTSIAEATGSASYSSITNAISPSGGTLPLNAGELSIAFQLGSDSSYVDTSVSLTVKVDTAYDMELNDSGVGWEAYFVKADTVPAGDTAVFSVWITNQSNAALPISFAHTYLSDSVFKSYQVYFDLNNNNQYDVGADQKVTGDSVMAADASGTFFFVVYTYDTSPDGSVGRSRGRITDSAPVRYGSTTGDGWEDTQPLYGSDDTEDTFIFTFRTAILGPLMRISKVIADSSGLRPGDTIQYKITYDNDGGDSANNLIIVDAVPNYTSFVTGSWNDSAPHDTTASIVVGFALSLGQDTFADAESSSIKKIRWKMNSPVGNTQGDGTKTVDYNGKNDNGIVRFTVQID